MDDIRKTRDITSKIVLSDGTYITDFVECGRGSSTICYICKKFSNNNILESEVLLKDWHDIRLAGLFGIDKPFDDIKSINLSDTLKKNYDEWTKITESNVDNCNYFLENVSCSSNVEQPKGYKLGYYRGGETLKSWIDENRNNINFVADFLNIIQIVLEELEKYHNEKGLDKKHNLHLDIKENNIYLIKTNGLIIPRLIDFGSAKSWSTELPSIEDLRSSSTTYNYVNTRDFLSGHSFSYEDLSDDEKQKYIYGIDLYSIAVIIGKSIGEYNFNDSFIKNKVEEIIHTGKNDIRDRYHCCSELKDKIEELINFLKPNIFTPSLVQYMNYRYVQNNVLQQQHIGWSQLEKIKQYCNGKKIDERLLPLCLDGSNDFFYKNIENSEKRIIYLYGDGGAGKSTLLHKLFVDYLNNKKPNNYFFYIPVKSLNDQVENCVADYINTRVLDNKLQIDLSNKTITLLIDGINEVEKIFAQSIVEELNRYEKVKIIITGRSNSISDFATNLCSSNEYVCFEIPKLTDDQIFKYISDNNKVVDYDDQLRELLGRPFLLQLYIKIVDSNVQKEPGLKICNEMQLIEEYFNCSIKEYNNKIGTIKKDNIFDEIFYEICKVAFFQAVERNMAMPIANILNYNFDEISAFGSTMFSLSRCEETIQVVFKHDLFCAYFVSHFILKEIVIKKNADLKIMFDGDNIRFLTEFIPYVAQLYSIEKNIMNESVTYNIKEYTSSINSYEGFFFYFLGLCIYGNNNIKKPLVCNNDKNEQFLLREIYAMSFDDKLSITLPSQSLTNKLAFPRTAFIQLLRKIKLVVLPDCIKVIGEDFLSMSTSLERIIFPNGIREIGEGVCSFCKSLKEINIPSSVEKIGDAAFLACEKVEKISVEEGNENYYSCQNCLLDRSGEYLLVGCKNSDIPDFVKNIGFSAFSSCDFDKNLIIPNNVEIIEDWAFLGCSHLKSVFIPDNVKFVGESAFESCKSLVSARLSKYMDCVSDSLFGDCTSLEEIIISGCIEKIEDCAFNGCIALKKVVITDRVKEIGEFVFRDCKNLTNIKLPSDITCLSNNLFMGCEALRKINIPNGVKTINDSAFYGCKKLKNLILPDNLTEIQSFAFGSCKSIVELVIPRGVQVIGDYAFAGCSHLTKIFISNTVSKIGELVFNLCDNLKEIIVEEGNERYCSFGNCIIDKHTQTLIYGCANSIIPDDGSVKIIHDQAFSTKAKKNIIIPESIIAYQKTQEEFRLSHYLDEFGDDDLPF